MIKEIQDAFTSSADTDWETPQDFFEHLNREFHFTYDVCANEKNFKMKPYYSEEQDAFKQVWRGTVFMNPPYGRGIGKWVEEAFTQAQAHATTVVALLPARTDTEWFHDDVMGASEVRLLKGRLSFVGTICVYGNCGRFASHSVHRFTSLLGGHVFTPGAEKAASPALFPSMVVVFKPGVHYPLFTTLAWKSGVCSSCGEPVFGGAGVHPSCEGKNNA